MAFRTVRNAQETLENLAGLSDRQRLNYQQAIDAAKRESLARGTKVLEGTNQRMLDEFDDLVQENLELMSGFDRLSALAERPDTDSNELAKDYADLSRRALVVKQRAERFEERAERHNQNASDPCAFYEAFTEKWSKMATNGDAQWLHQMDF